MRIVERELLTPCGLRTLSQGIRSIVVAMRAVPGIATALIIKAHNVAVAYGSVHHRLCEDVWSNRGSQICCGIA